MSCVFCVCVCVWTAGLDVVPLGYLYFHKAPDARSFHQECVRRVKNLHTADCLRANKSTMAWGLEARVPFLDKAFLEVAMNIDPAEKMFAKGAEQQLDADGCPRMEKYVLRKAFDCAPDGKPYLPRSILWRQKEQFSDGVGYSWIDGSVPLFHTLLRLISPHYHTFPNPKLHLHAYAHTYFLTKKSFLHNFSIP